MQTEARMSVEEEKVRVERTSAPDTFTNPVNNREVKQIRLRDSLGRHYMASGTTPPDTDRWEILVFPVDSNGEGQPSNVIVATGKDFDVAQQLLEDWLNGSGDRGDPPSIMQELSWRMQDTSEDEVNEWIRDPEVFGELVTQLAGNVTSRDPDLALGSTVGIAMMLGVDLSDAPPEIEATLRRKGLWPYDDE